MFKRTVFLYKHTSFLSISRFILNPIWYVYCGRWPVTESLSVCLKSMTNDWRTFPASCTHVCHGLNLRGVGNSCNCLLQCTLNIHQNPCYIVERNTIVYSSIHVCKNSSVTEHKQMHAVLWGAAFITEQ